VFQEGPENPALQALAVAVGTASAVCGGPARGGGGAGSGLDQPPLSQTTSTQLAFTTMVLCSGGGEATNQPSKKAT